MFWCKYFISLSPEKNYNLTFGKCNHRGKECVYVQSRRGGARVPRSKRQDNEKADYVKIAQECECCKDQRYPKNTIDSI